MERITLLVKLRSRSRPSLCDNSDAYTLVSGAITIAGAENEDAARELDKRNKEVRFKNCAPFTDCVSEINNTQIDNSKYIDVVMSMYNLINIAIIIRKHQEVCGNIT